MNSVDTMTTPAKYISKSLPSLFFISLLCSSPLIVLLHKDHEFLCAYQANGLSVISAFRFIVPLAYNILSKYMTYHLQQVDLCFMTASSFLFIIMYIVVLVFCLVKLMLYVKYLNNENTLQLLILFCVTAGFSFIAPIQEIRIYLNQLYVDQDGIFLLYEALFFCLAPVILSVSIINVFLLCRRLVRSMAT